MILLLLKTLLLLVLFIMVGFIIKKVSSCKLSALTVGFMFIVFMIGILALPFSIFSWNVQSYFTVVNIMMLLLTGVTGAYYWQKRTTLALKNWKLKEWIVNNWFVCVLILVTIMILFIDYYPTLYSVSNTDDTTYIGGQLLTTYFNQKDPTSGFEAGNVGIIQKIVTWKYVWMYYSNVLGIDPLIFNRLVLGLIMPIVFYVSIHDFFRIMMPKSKKTQYLLIPIMLLLIYPIFSWDSWGQIRRVIYMPWFASAYSFIVYPFLVILFCQKGLKKNKKSLALFCSLSLFGIMLHQVNVFVLFIFIMLRLIYLAINRISKDIMIWIIGVIGLLNIVLLVSSIITGNADSANVYQLQEISLLIADIQKIPFLLVQASLFFAYILISRNRKSTIGIWIYFAASCILCITLVPGLLELFITVTGGYEFATRRIIDVFIFMQYVLIGIFIFNILRIFNKKQKVIFFVPIVLIIMLEIGYPNKITALLPKLKKIDEYTYLDIFENPQRIHPLINELNQYFSKETTGEVVVFGSNYIYSAGVDESLYFVPTLTLINSNINVINDIRNGESTSEDKKQLELLNDYFRCEKNICLSTSKNEMIKLFENINNKYGLTHIVISEKNNDQIHNPLYDYFQENYVAVTETKYYDFTYNFTIFELGENR